MTHSLHRCGNTAADRDFVWLMYQSKGINDDDIAGKARSFMRVVDEVGSVNWGDVKSGPVVALPEQQVREKIGDSSRLRGVFTSEEQVAEFLRRIAEEDIGLSVIIAGRLDLILAACRSAGVPPHTINFSLGVFGNTERLPSDTVLEITTMCGHHMVPDGIVQRELDRVCDNKTSAREAAERLASFCPCGIFNQVRAEEILRSAAEAE